MNQLGRTSPVDQQAASFASEEIGFLAEEQAALRRVATLVAEGAATQEVLSAVAAEVAHLLDVPMVQMIRYDPDRMATVVAGWGDPFPVGSRWPLDGPSITGSVLQTGEPARIDDYADLPGTKAEVARGAGIRSAVGVPILVDGRAWGAIATGSQDRVLPSETEAQLADFTELVATAIANAQAHDRVERREEGLRLLAEVGKLLSAAPVEPDLLNVVAQRATHGFSHCCLIDLEDSEDLLQRVATAWPSPPAKGDIPTSISLRVAQSRRECVIPSLDEDAVATLADHPRERKLLISFISYMCLPLEARDRCFGALTLARSSGAPFDGDDIATGRDLATRLAVAIDNTRLQREQVRMLEESRARVIEAQDAERRRLERNLHDGAQQRLVSIGLDLQALRSSAAADLNMRSNLEQIQNDLGSVLDDVREISRGLHPAVLGRAGLAAAVKSIARRSSVPVELRVQVPARLSESIETAAYYVVSEALANAGKHSGATLVRVSVLTDDQLLRIQIADDGIGGADTTAGSGLIGLVDRVEALGGRLELRSPPGQGTELSVDLPHETREKR